MSMTSRILLALSIIAFAFGFSGVFWSIGLPIGAILFGLFLISKLLETETLLFDAEQRVRHAMANAGRQDSPVAAEQTHRLREVQLAEIPSNA